MPRYGSEVWGLSTPEEWADYRRRKREERLKLEIAKAEEMQKKREARAHARLEAEWARRRKKAARLLKYGDHSMDENNS